MLRLLIENNELSINKCLCIECGKETKKLAKGKCNSCYSRDYCYQLYINSPLKKCECKPECTTMIHSLGKKGTPVKYALYHHPRGENHQSWKGGRVRQREYWILWWPDHPNATKIGYVPEHVYNFTEYNKCCMLPWGVVHHKDENKENNMVWNLEGMYRPNHGKHHNPLMDFSDRKCSICKTNTTYRDKSGHCWFKDGNGGFWCKKCYDKEYHRKQKLKSINKNLSLYIK